MDTSDILGTIGIACLVILLIILIWWLWRRACTCNSGKDNQAHSARSTVLTTAEESQINNRISEETPINSPAAAGSNNDYGSDYSSQRYKDFAAHKELPSYNERTVKTQEKDVDLEGNDSTRPEIGDTRSLSKDFGNETFNKHLSEEAIVNILVKDISPEEEKDIPLNGEITALPKAPAVEDIPGFVETEGDKVEFLDVPVASVDPEVQKKLQKLKEIERDAIQWAEKIPEALKIRREFLHVREMLLRGIDAADLTYANGVDVIKEEKRRVIAYIDNQVNELESKKPEEFG